VGKTTNKIRNLFGQPWKKLAHRKLGRKRKAHALASKAGLPGPEQTWWARNRFEKQFRKKVEPRSQLVLFWGSDLGLQSRFQPAFACSLSLGLENFPEDLVGSLHRHAQAMRVLERPRLGVVLPQPRIRRPELPAPHRHDGQGNRL